MRALPALARFALAAALVARAAGAHAQVDAGTLKAAFVYHFVQYTTWSAPTRADAALTLCVPARSPLAAPLAAIDGKPAERRTIRVRDVAAHAAGDGCDVRIVDTASPPPAGEAGALTICDCGDELATMGSVIALVQEGTRLRFDVDLDAAQKAHLSLSSKLLHLARTTR
jgi:hypothetical protein